MALVQLFAQVGVPQKIVTDQRTTLCLLYWQLGIKGIKTMLDHPQIHSCVKRFNQMLIDLIRY